MATAASPSSSPRLPSPPPIAEVQLGPKSPTISTEDQGKLRSSLDHGAARRIRPGTKAVDMAEGPPLVDITEIDSAFQLTEHLKALHYAFTHPNGSDTVVPINKQKAIKLAQAPEGVDRTLWLYELCRFLIQKVNSIITALFSDDPPCSAQTCEEMRASEWQYLCAVHDPPRSCCAIDYCCHTLDWSANILTNTKQFPSRLSLGTDPNIIHQQARHLTNIFRRVYRIFAHAWFQHREMFWKVETKTGLYIFFKTVCDVYALIPEDNYTIPLEAEGIQDEKEVTPIVPPVILTRGDSSQNEDENPSLAGDYILSAGNTTKRHRHSPSVGATPITTVVEENEETEDDKEKQNEQDSKEETPSKGPEPDAKPEPEAEPEPASESMTETSEPPEEKSDETVAPIEEHSPSSDDKEAEKQNAEEPIDPVGEAVEGDGKATEDPAPVETDAKEAGEPKTEEASQAETETETTEKDESTGDPDTSVSEAEAKPEK